MKLALLNDLSKTPIPQPVAQVPALNLKREKSLLSELRETVENASVVEIQEQEEICFAAPDALHFFGIETGSPEHSEMEEEFRHLSRSNPRLCQKIMHLD